MQKDIVQTTIRFPAERHEQLRIEVAKRRLKSIQQAIDEALDLWIGAPSSAAPASMSLAKEETREAALYLDFLRHGDPAAVELVQHALEAHARRQRARKKASA